MVTEPELPFAAAEARKALEGEDIEGMAVLIARNIIWPDMVKPFGVEGEYPDWTWTPWDGDVSAFTEPTISDHLGGGGSMSFKGRCYSAAMAVIEHAKNGRQTYLCPECQNCFRVAQCSTCGGIGRVELKPGEKVKVKPVYPPAPEPRREEPNEFGQGVFCGMVLTLICLGLIAMFVWVF